MKIGLPLTLLMVIILAAGCNQRSNIGSSPSNTANSPTNVIIGGPYRTPSPEASQPVVINGKQVDAQMSDEQIAEIFGIDIKKATPRRTQGKDGYSMHYESGPQSVDITRSVVTGMYIMASGPIKGDWKVGK